MLLILYLLLPGTNLVYGNLEFMKHLFSKCSRKVKAFDGQESHQSTILFVKAVPMSGYELMSNNQLHLHWDFPVVDQDLVSHLKRSQLVLTTKPLNSIFQPEITFKRDNSTFSTFKLPRFQQFVKIDLGNNIQKNQGQGVASIWMFRAKIIALSFFFATLTKFLSFVFVDPTQKLRIFCISFATNSSRCLKRLFKSLILTSFIIKTFWADFSTLWYCSYHCKDATPWPWWKDSSKRLTFILQSPNSPASIQNYFHLQNGEASRPILLLRFRHCSTSKKRRRKIRKAQIRSKRNERSSQYIEEKLLFADVPRRRLTKREEAAVNNYYCQIKAKSVDVKDLGHSLSQRLLLPRKLEINQCQGSCHVIYSLHSDVEMSNHARIRELYK